MDQSNKHIDELVTNRNQKHAELLAIGQEIAASATPIVVAFVDLTESTQLKQDRDPESWLGYIFEFIKYVDQLARAADGTVVKRIGDELMVTFKNVQSSEHFVDSLTTDSPLKPYRYKVALDYGSAYHFRFLEHLPDDPYGLVVDRCARIAKFAVAGTVLCTDDYRQQVGRSADYVSMGAFALHGFRKPEKLFVRCLVAVDSDEYLKPIVNALNKEAQRVAAYRYVGRKVTTEFMRQFGEGGARPFLARELLNVPKLPYSPKEFDDLMSTADNDEIQHEYVGYFVDWQGTFDKYTRDEYDITVLLKAGNSEGPYGHVYVNLLLPHSSFELVHQLKKGQRLRARGIITTIFLRIITLNYVDLETVAKS